MKNKLDEALKHALTPSEEPDFWLNHKVLSRAAKIERGVCVKQRKVPSAAAAVMAVLLLCLGTVTVYAAWKYLSPADVAGKMQDAKLADVFNSEEALIFNESQSLGGYRVTLLGVVSGDMLSDYMHYDGNGDVKSERSYAVVAIENADGTPMPDTSEEAYGKLDFFASFLIGGYDPALYNLADMGGSYGELSEDGILYRILECDTVELFADHELYLCVTEGAFYNKEAYEYEEETGEISRNESFQGLNTLFRLPMDPSAADPKRAEEYIKSLGAEPDIRKERLTAELGEDFKIEGDGTGARAAQYAMEFIGNPYEWGGESLTEGTDSSGFTMSVYKHFGVDLPHASTEQRKLGEPVEGLENAMPGDLIFYETPLHAAIYIGDGKIVHAMSDGMGICVSMADFDEIAEIRRLCPDSPVLPAGETSESGKQ